MLPISRSAYYLQKVERPSLTALASVFCGTLDSINLEMLRGFMSNQTMPNLSLSKLLSILTPTSLPGLFFFMIQLNRGNGPNSSSLKLQCSCVRSKSGREQRQSQCLGPQMGRRSVESIHDEEHIWSWESEFLRIDYPVVRRELRY